MKIENVTFLKTFLPVKNENIQQKNNFIFPKGCADSISFSAKAKSSPQSVARALEKAQTLNDSDRIGKTYSILKNYFKVKGSMRAIVASGGYKRRLASASGDNYRFSYRIDENSEILATDRKLAYRNGAELFQVEHLPSLNTFMTSRKESYLYQFDDFTYKLKNMFESEPEIDCCIAELEKFQQTHPLKQLHKNGYDSKNIKDAEGKFSLVANTPNGDIYFAQNRLSVVFDEGKNIDVSFDKSGRMTYAYVKNHKGCATKILAQ